MQLKRVVGTCLEEIRENLLGISKDFDVIHKHNID